jgi:hypothetical protein
MNVCCVCEADGVAEVLGGWYCIDHLEDGFLTLAQYLARARGWDPDETEAALIDWIDS